MLRMKPTLRVKIGELTQSWMVHPRSEGDLVLTSDAAIAIVDTRNRFALTGSTLKALENYQSRDLVTLRQDVVDRILDAEATTKASPLPVCKIDFSELGVAVRHG